MIRIDDDRIPATNTGTTVRVPWPNSACSKLAAECRQFLQLATGFAVLNPHLGVSLNAPQGRRTFQATNRDWKKWLPSQPTSPHWYTSEDLAHLIAAYIKHDTDHGRVRTVSRFLAEFAGLQGKKKRDMILEKLGLTGADLTVFAPDDSHLDRAKVHSLLNSMQRASRPVNPKKLGVIGKDHIEQRFVQLGIEADSFRYKKIQGTDQGLPYIIEAASGYAPQLEEDRQIISGVNWSPAFGSVLFRQLGDNWTLDGLLQERKCGWDEPVLICLHLATPKPYWQDRGKSTVSLKGELADQFVNAIHSVTKHWAKLRKQEERDDRRRADRSAAVRKSGTISLKAAAERVIPSAYDHASGGGEYPAGARQVMYAARHQIQQLARKPLKDDYFTQQLLPDFCAEHPELTADWEITYDARGNFHEPHTDRTVALGTLGIRSYANTFRSFSAPWLSQVRLPDLNLGSLATCGPAYRFSGVLFIEKEGFLPLFEKMKLQERFDLAIMSTKGVSNTASRELLDELAGYAKDVLGRPLPVYVLHDFDVAGFKILGTLAQHSRRYAFGNAVEVVDLGLRLEDCQSLSLESEAAPRKGSSKPQTLRRHQATEEEIEFLLDGRRVELNAMTSPQMVQWLESKLKTHNVQKVVPADDVLECAYRQLAAQEELARRISRISRQIEKKYETVHVPSGLATQIHQALDQAPARSWDKVLKQVIRGENN